MFGLAKKWLLNLWLPVFLFFMLTPAAVWAADDEGASQIYAIYAAGQQGAEKNNNGSSDININNDKKEETEPADNMQNEYEPVPGYAQNDNQPGNAAGVEESDKLNNNQDNNNLNNNQDNNPENNPEINNETDNQQPLAEPDFPALADSLEVLLWDAASQTNQKTRVTPVNLALRGSFLPSDVPALAVSGRTLVPVRLISEQMQAAVDWDKATNTVTISRGAQTILLTIGSSTALVNDRPVQVPGDVSVTLVTHEGTARTMVPVRFVVENLEASVNYDQARRIVDITPSLWQAPEETPVNPEPEPEPIPPPGIDENGNLLRRVVLDPGHGGTDPGTNGGGYDEKDINLAVALKLQTVLQNAGFEVIMARGDDSYLGLAERAALTVQEDAPVFVSIHCNSAANIPSASGIETYAAPDDADDAELAGYIQKELIALTGAKDRGVKTSPLIVLTYNAAPACLVEIGFMSNSAECAKIAESTYQQKLAEAVAAGVEAYFTAKAEQNI